MRKQMVECEDGRRRQARVYGFPLKDGEFVILQAGVRVRGKHVTGEAWYNQRTGIWYFLTGKDEKKKHLLPRRRERPPELALSLYRSPMVRTI